MQAINRWRTWKPTGEKFGHSPYPEVPKVPKPTSGTFGTSIPGQTRNFSDGIPAPDPAAWAEDFHRWALSNCVYRDRCFGGIGALHRDFCQWTLSHDSVPCRDETFEQLLRNAGFFFADGLVYGLVPKEDAEIARNLYRSAQGAHTREKG